MSSAARHSARLLLDLQACQTQGSANRGVGRYSMGLLAALAHAAAPRDLRILLSDALPNRPRRLPVGTERVVRMPPLPDWRTDRDFNRGERDSLDALAYTALAQRYKPDLVHVSHVFEGLGDRVPLPDLAQRGPGQVVSATLYDLIPLIQQDHYFELPGLKPWYLARTAWLRQADLLLAISESTRRDAIERLDIDPGRIVAVHGGISAHFRPPADRADALRALQARYPLKDRYVLYTGGDDHRKNLPGAIEGFAGVPPELRRNLQLVIVCEIHESRRRHFMDLARRHGLGATDVLITGFVPEPDLVGLYGACELFVFPSRYEGLGLPVIEAMACGAPVIGGDNSSVREIIGRADALFDPDSPASIAARIAGVLGTPCLRDTLARHGSARAAEYTWSRTAALALEAFDAALDRARGAGVTSAVHGWTPRRRLAIHSPLPPLRSGIADYNAQFLPYLARHFDIDLYVGGQTVDGALLNAAFRVFDVRDFAPVAASYDAILYEFGNSEFHASMPDLLDRFPGVVGLHDAYLSGLFHYLAAMAGRPGEFHAEMLRAHGPRARRLLAAAGSVEDRNEAAIVELPCTKRVLDRALGLISHSEFNLAVALRNHPEGWLAPYRTIPQMVVRPPALTNAARIAVRQSLGFGPEDFVVATFGHVAWTKWGDRLLDAFLRSALRDDRRAHLVFAGELSRDPFGHELERAVRSSGLGERIRITGYLAADAYERHLACADVAVQLRTRSRGGTPKGVLDCLVRGIPTMVNHDASFTDYPDDTVIKLPPDPAVGDLADALDRARTDRDWRERHAGAGRDHVERNHSPARCAAQYAAAIAEFTGRHCLSGDRTWTRAFAPHIAACPDREVALRAVADWLAALPEPCFRRRRLLVDVSHIVVSDHQTGVPRVVRQILRSFLTTTRAGIEPMAVALQDGRLVVPRDWLVREGMLLAQEFPAAEETIAPGAGDVLLMLDSSWARYREFHPVFERARSAGAMVVTAVYDLLPIVLPPGNIVEGGKEWFDGWICDAIRQSDGLVCISRAVAEQVIEFANSRNVASEGLKIGYWHLGSDFSDRVVADEVPPRVREAAAAPYVLMMGTIEPRKCHAQALDAAEQLWAEGESIRLVVAGKEGWMVGDLMARLRAHPRLGTDLLVIEQPSDAEVAALYDHAAGLLFLSRGEGFGLPLVEAANHGVPILCSDLPVFREIAGAHASYVSSEDPATLARELAAWWAAIPAGTLPDSSAMPRLTWEQSAEALLAVILDGRWHWVAPAPARS